MRRELVLARYGAAWEVRVLWQLQVGAKKAKGRSKFGRKSD
jgi:hypothetical protein